jgi:arylformamidase
MSAIDLEAEYNNRARVPEHPAIIAGWARNAAVWREERAASLGVHAYGSTPRQTLALFAGGGRGLPVLFIHGGYWQGLDPSFFSHMARGLNLRGHDVAVIGYDLCPDVTVADIVAQARAATALLAGLADRRVVVTGHSAGGHLAACLAADPALPVAAGLAISGLFELEPLVPTSVNLKLGLDLAEARRLSPRLGPAPPADRPFDAWVGGRESAEYLRQSRGIAAAWAAHGVPTRYEEVPGADHFTVIAGLADPGSAMVERLGELAS